MSAQKPIPPRPHKRRAEVSAYKKPPEKRKRWPAIVALVLVGALATAGASLLFRAEEATRASAGKSPTVVSDRTSTEKPVTIKLLMIGDILLHDQLNEHARQADGSYDYSFLFQHMGERIKDADVAILNQETILGDPANGYAMTGYKVPLSDSGTEDDGNYLYIPVFNSPTAVADAEVAAGFNVILKAHNHVFDQGYSGLSHELAYWTSTYPKIPVLGVADPDGASGAPNYVDNIYIYEKDGFRVAILNYAMGANTSGGDSDASVVSWLTADKVSTDVAKARDAGADMIVACPHWGNEYETSPSPTQAANAQMMADAGVDVILGTHPHILQPVQVLTGAGGNTCVCYFSNGSFCSSALPEANAYIAGIDYVTLTKDVDGNCSITAATFEPTVMDLASSDMSAWPLVDYTDEVAASNSASSLTRQHVLDFCSQVLGSGFDAATGIYTVPL